MCVQCQLGKALQIRIIELYNLTTTFHFFQPLENPKLEAERMVEMAEAFINGKFNWYKIFVLHYFVSFLGILVFVINIFMINSVTNGHFFFLLPNIANGNFNELLSFKAADIINSKEMEQIFPAVANCEVNLTSRFTGFTAA